MINQEFHAFGPWIYEINNMNPMPPLFVPYFNGENNYLKLVKIPRNIDRRDAKPGMDLYDFVIGMYEDHIYILKRIGITVQEIKVYYSDINGIELLSELLKGTLNIYLKDSIITIHFNTSSTEIVMQLINIIRDRYTKKTFTELKSQYFSNDINVDELYINLFNNMESKEGDIHICAVQSSIPVTFNNGSFMQRLQHLTSQRVLLNTLHLTNNRELIILTRGKAFKLSKMPDYDYAYFYIPVERLSDVMIQEYELYDKILELNLKMNENICTFYFEDSNLGCINFYNNIKTCANKLQYEGY